VEYFKINSLWKRQEYVKDKPKGTHGHLIVGDYSEPEFGNIKHWRVSEKVDGTNIRIFFNSHLKELHVSFSGRTDNAQLPPHLLEYLQSHFTSERLCSVFKPDESGRIPSVFLFGEGYGPKIQSGGGNYRKDAGFILFDVIVDNWVLKVEDVKEIALKLEIPMVPDLGVMRESEIVEFVKSKPMSQCSHVPQMMEGVVCRSEPLMLFRNRRPVMFKLKCKEFL